MKNLSTRLFQSRHSLLGLKKSIGAMNKQIVFKFNTNQSQNELENNDNVSLYALNNKIYEIKEDAPTGQVVKAKNDILYFTNFDKNRLKLKALLALENDSNRSALVLSLNEKISTALCLNRIQYNTKIQDENIKIANPNGLTISLNGKQICGKVINFRGDILKDNIQVEKSENGQDIEQSQQQQQKHHHQQQQKTKINSANHNDFDVEFNILDFKEDPLLRQKRYTSKHQIFTGNISVDMTSPICQGNFVIFNGDINTGKSHLAAEMIKQNCKLNPNTIGIFATQSFATAEKMQSELSNNENSMNNFIIISPNKDENSGIAEKYLAPFSAMHLAKKLQQEQGKDVILIYDNLYDHFYQESLIFGQIDMPCGFKSALKEQFSMSGFFGDRNGSITSIAIFDSNRSADKYAKETSKLFQEAESYADVIVDFQLNDPLMRQVRPKIELKGKQLFSVPKWQNNLYLEIAKELHEVLVDLQGQSKEIELKNELKIQVEPWDYYLYFDSKYFMRLLVSSNYFTPVEQIVFVKFLLKCIHEETISQFKENPQELTKSFFKFAKEFKEFNKQDIFTYMEKEFNYNSNTIHENTLVNLQHCVLRLYELFIMHCKMNDKLLPFKKDYFH